MPDHVLGLDLGRMSDRTALAIVKRTMMLQPNGVLPARDHRGRTLYRFNVRQAKVYKLHTPYPEIIAHVRDRVLNNPRYGERPRLVVDATGVGGAVIDMLLSAKLPAEVLPLTITGGDSVRKAAWPGSHALGWWVAKGQLCSAVQAALQDERLKVSDIPHEPGMPDPGAILKAELKGFTVQVSKAANEIYSHREGEHDDLLLAVAMAVFIGGRREAHYGVRGGFTASEDATLKTERETEEAAQAKADQLAKDEAFRERERQDDERRKNVFHPSWTWR